MENKDLSQFVGKTIEKIEWIPAVVIDEINHAFAPTNDDGDRLLITFSDTSKIYVEPYYKEWTGKSLEEYPTFLDVSIQEPEGFNGPGMYEAKPINTRRIGDEYSYVFNYGGEEYIIQTELFRFYADSLEHAKEILDPEEHAYIKWYWPKL